MFGVLWDAAKVALAVWGVLAVEPFLEKDLPNLDEGWRYLISAIFAAIILEFLFQTVLGWPRIHVHWTVAAEDAPISEIVARVTKRKTDSQVFSLSISTPSGGWVGYQFLKFLMLLGVTLQIRIEQASLVPSVEKSRKVGERPTVTPDDESKGFSIDLGKVPRCPGQWHWAEVNWRDETSPRGVDFNVDYILHHENAVARIILFTFVRRTTNARTFRVVGP